MGFVFRHAVCNELYGERAFAESCRAARRAGYSGYEIAPFTLGENAPSIAAAARREYCAALAGEGLRFVGLHWILVGPKGLHITTPDDGVRRRSWEYLRALVDLCADLGPEGIMVLGSPKQRSSTGGLSGGEATRLLVEGLAELAPHAAARGVTVLLEPLSPDQTDVVTSLEEAASIVRTIGSPAVRTMFDCHNAQGEREPHPALVGRYFDLIRHVHVNEMDGRHPGTGQYDFRALLDALASRDYRGWVSLEVFDFSLGADRIAEDSLRYLEGLE
jgi:D-psicose/D-tagatose/L-ribulose 3-epimerase